MNLRPNLSVTWTTGGVTGREAGPIRVGFQVFTDKSRMPFFSFFFLFLLSGINVACLENDLMLNIYN